MTTTIEPRYSIDRHPYGDAFAEERSVEPPKHSITITPADAIKALLAWRDGQTFEDWFELEEFRDPLNDEPVEAVVEIAIKEQ